MKVYVVHHENRLLCGSTKFYKTRELARTALKKKRDGLVHKALGVRVIEDTKDRFSFIFGWEEYRVTWRVSEIEVLENDV